MPVMHDFGIMRLNDVENFTADLRAILYAPHGNKLTMDLKEIYEQLRKRKKNKMKHD
jgi:hypothetical protein